MGDEERPGRRSRARKRYLPGANLPALVVLLVITAVGGLYVYSYSVALGAPRPREVPIGVVGERASEVEQAFDAVASGSVVATRFSSVVAARTAIDEQHSYAAFVRTGPDTADLLISSASGPSVSRVLSADGDSVGSALGLVVTVQDVHPVSIRDPSGVVFFYVALASVIMGFIGTIQTRSNAPALTLLGELRWDLLRAVTVSLAITTVVGPVALLEPVPFLPTWGVLALTSLTAGMTYACWRLLIGNRWAMLPTWLLFVLISSPASGGAVADPLLPPVLAVIGRFLPTGATVSILRDTTYFADFPHVTPYVVLMVWAVVTTTAWVLLRRHRVGTGVPPSAEPDPAPKEPGTAAAHG
jgi:hypothetical protein